MMYFHIEIRNFVFLYLYIYFLILFYIYFMRQNMRGDLEISETHGGRLSILCTQRNVLVHVIYTAARQPGPQFSFVLL